MKKVLRAAYARTPSSVRLMYGRMWKARAFVDRLVCSERDVENRLKGTNLFFLLGSGRCGTQLISSMLNKAPNTLALHEPHRHEDVGTRPMARRNPEFALRYVHDYRRYEIYKKVREHDVANYGEVSSPLRCLGEALRTEFPHARFFILVRDPRTAIRSAMNRQMRKKGEDTGVWNHEPVRPLPDDPYAEQWDRMTPYEKFCWWWMDSYRMLLDHLPGAPIVQFEKIVSSWDYVRDEIVEPIGLEIGENEWLASVTRKSDNAAPTYVVESFDDWPDDQREAFIRICGETMERVGYSM
ncbi:MAG: hypothetical protein ACF8PN_09675 [Phycisphaerales bacterium]